VDDTSSGFVEAITDYLRRKGAVGPSLSLPLPLVEQECPKPLLLPRAVVPALLRQWPQHLGMVLDVDNFLLPTWRLWAVADHDTAAAATAKTPQTPPRTSET
jgi:hypothetical protein